MTARGRMGSPDRATSTSWRRLGGLLSLLVATLLLIAAILATTLVPRHLQQRVQANQAELEEAIRPARSLTGDLRATFDQEAASVRGYLLNRDVANKERYQQARVQEDSILLQLAPLARRLGGQTEAQLADLRSRAGAWHADQERLLLGAPGFAPEFLRSLPAQQEMYDQAGLATERLDATLAGIEASREERLAELRTLEPPVMRGLAWLAGLAVLISLLLAGRLVVLSRRPTGSQLVESESRFDDLAESIREVFWIRDAETGRFVYVSPAYEGVWGRSREPLYAGYGPFLATVHSEDRERVEAVRPPAEVEYRIVRPDGTVRWIAERCISMSDAGDGAARWLGVAADVTERFQARQHLAHLALHDPVTGLGNHLLLLDRLEHAVARARRAGTSVGVLVVDVDDLQAVNEKLGRRDGDRLLAVVGECLQATLRQEDTLVRLGEDAFMAVLEQVDGRPAVLRAAGRVSALFETPFRVAGEEVQLNAHVVGAWSAPGDLTAADIGRLADEALHRSRFDATPPFEPVDSIAIDAPGGRYGRSRLRQALHDEEFRILYQPIVDLQTERVVGLEALLRWGHPERGLLLPGEFLGLAEESGLIHPLGLWVLRQVCSDLRAWEEGPSPLRDAWVAVNLSPLQFELPEFVDELARILDGSGVLPERLRVEVDEATWFRARGPLQRLRRLGVGVTVDEFGERYGALGALERLPVDGIKLGRGLGFAPFGRRRTSSAVASFVGLASGLDLEVTAVGIENTRELRDLRAIGCPTGQGFHFSPPLDAAELRGWVTDRRAGQAQAR